MLEIRDIACVQQTSNFDKKQKQHAVLFFNQNSSQIHLNSVQFTIFIINFLEFREHRPGFLTHPKKL